MRVFPGSCFEGFSRKMFLRVFPGFRGVLPGFKFEDLSQRLILMIKMLPFGIGKAMIPFLRDTSEDE